VPVQVFAITGNYRIVEQVESVREGGVAKAITAVGEHRTANLP
jgi:hypothetical protein